MAKILIIDDDSEFLDAAATVLEAKGFAIISAHDGPGGYAAAKQQRPDLVLLDVMMKADNEGFEIARKLHEDPSTRRLPVIVITGIRKAKGLPFGFEPDEDWLPVKAVLEKPVRPDLLVREVEKGLKAKRSVD